MSLVGNRKKRKNDTSGRKKNLKSKLDLLTCSRGAMVNAAELLRKRMKAGKINVYKRAVELPKCKESIVRNFGALSASHLCVQLRNALLAHNWEAAAHLLMQMLKFSKPLSYPQIWRSYFILLQHLQRDTTRMEKFVELCSNLLKQENVLEGLHLFMDS